MTRDDLDAAQRWLVAAAMRRAAAPWRERIVMAAVTVSLFAAAVLATLVLLKPPHGLVRGPDVVFAAVIAAALGYGIAFILIGVTSRRIGQRVRALDEAGLGPTTIRIDRDGVVIEQAFGATTRLPWPAIRRIDVTERQVAFRRDDYHAHVLPRGWLGGAAEQRALWTTVARWAPALVPHLSSGPA